MNSRATIDLTSQQAAIANPFDSLVKRVKKVVDGYSKLKEAKQISKHFSDFLSPVVAKSDDCRTKVFNIRHQVYCEELNFEPLRDNEQENDEFDQYSIHAMIQHKQSGNFAGTVRIVTPDDESKQLPIEKYCLHSITDEKLSPANFGRSEVCEISRLAVPAQFRRRKIDKFAGAATGVINPQTYSQEELRCFPFIAIGLYMSAASIVMAKNIPHTYVMMEPRLARSMGFLGIKFHKLGPTVEYHGQRAPYYINPHLLLKNLTPAFTTMLKDIQAAIDEQKHLFNAGV